MKRLWEQLTAGDPDVRSRAEVLTLTAAAQRLLREAGAPSTLITESDVLDAGIQDVALGDQCRRGTSLSK